MGYYATGTHKLGPGGEFTTAPEISSLFGQSLAAPIQDVLLVLDHADILEFGAGTGKLASDILSQLKQNDSLPKHYFILETSPDLIERQQALLQQQHADYFAQIQWITTIPATFNGVMLANEVCDAMPVHLLRFESQQIYERYITVNHGEFCWQDHTIKDKTLAQQAEQIAAQLTDYPYQTEVNLNAQYWLKTAVNSLQQGAIFIVDYGYPFAEFYHAQRQQGSLRCYYRQRAHDNVFFMPGLQDITAHIDFTSLASVAHQQGAAVAGFHEQADFLLAAGITELAAKKQEILPPADWLQYSAALKQLLLPSGMGHQFKVLSLTKALAPLSRLAYHDRRYQL